MRSFLAITFGLVCASASASEEVDQCAHLLARTTPVTFREFVTTAWQTKNIHALVDRLEAVHGGRSFRVSLGAWFGKRTVWLLQDRDLVLSVMKSDSKLPFVNRNFDASHGHARSINSVDVGEALWFDLHNELKNIFAHQKIVPYLEKHKDILLQSTRFNLNDTLEEFYMKVWAEYCFGPVDYEVFKGTRDRLVDVLGKVFHQNPVNRVPYLGAVTSRLNRLRYRRELKRVDAELGEILKNAIRHKQGAFYELYARLEPKYADAFRITRDNSFLAVLVYDFIHVVMLDTLAHAAKSPEIDRKEHLVNGRHHAFLYPFRFRVLSEDHQGFRKGDFAIVNLQKTQLYFSAGARFCPGAGVFGDLSRYTLALLEGRELKLVDPDEEVTRSSNRDLPFMTSRHDVTLSKCPMIPGVSNE
jgi:hypothetical protein